MVWHPLGSRQKPTKSLAKLKAEVDKLKEAEENVKSHEVLQSEKEKLIKEIKKEGFKLRHRKALAIIHNAESITGRIARKTDYYTKVGLKKARPYVHRFLKKRHAKLSKYI